VTEVVVVAPARLHFGMLDPAGLGTRRFGGFGVGVESPRVVVAARRTSGDTAAAGGMQAERALQYARSARSAFGLDDGVEVDVRETIPPHVGLGSGTKLGLAIARAVAELAGVTAGPEALAHAAGRGARSSVGSWTFSAPGLVVEAGVRDEVSLSPLVARYPMPDRWRCVLVLPLGVEGLSGSAEERFFSALGEPGQAPPAEPAVARLLVTSLLPGLLAADIEEFGAALTEIQRQVGTIFAAQQGGMFHPQAAAMVEALLGLGVRAVGQSSWGPAVYGIVADPEAADRVADRLREATAGAAQVSVVAFDRRGAQVVPDGRAEGAIGAAA
jgi:beta-RFAP synthase